MHKFIILFFILCFTSGEIDAQGTTRNGFAAYIMTETQWNQLYDIYPMLYNDQLFPSIDVENLTIRTHGARIGMMATFDDNPFFTTVDIGVFTYEILKKPFKGGHFQLENSAGLKNRIIFDHDRLSVNFMPGARILRENDISPHIQLGFRWDVVMGDNIRYDSNEPEFDLDIRQSLENGITQRNNFSLACALGIDFYLGNSCQITAKGHYYRGIVDVLRTEPNPFLWRDLKSNKLHAYSASVTFSYFIDE